MTSELSVLEIRAEEHHRKTAKFDPILKQWSVQLPWIDPDPESHALTDNFRRCRAMMSKVHDTVHPDDMDMVNEAYLSMIREGFAEEIPSDEMVPNWSTYWLTSRPVIRRNAQTTKCRIVSNGSCPDQNDRSKTLNKMLMPGPNKLPHIMELIMRFMVVAHVFLIDIQKMFLSIRLELKSDQDMLRFMLSLIHI